jgi:beta-glucosidase
MNENLSLEDIPQELREQLAQEMHKPVFGEKVIEEHMPALCRAAAAEGAVLLKNQNNVLPLKQGQPVAVFGRVQLDWFYVGYGSGGDVNPPYTVNLMEGLQNAGVQVDKELASVYAKWSAENVPDMGFWAHRQGEPLRQAHRHHRLPL